MVDSHINRISIIILKTEKLKNLFLYFTNFISQYSQNENYEFTYRKHY